MANTVDELDIAVNQFLLANEVGDTKAFNVVNISFNVATPVNSEKFYTAHIHYDGFRKVVVTTERGS